MLVLLTLIPSEMSILSQYSIFIFYTEIHLRKLVDNICIFKKIALPTITITGISIVLFRGNFSLESSLIFINLSSKSSDFLVTYQIKSLTLIHGSSYFFILSLLSLGGIGVKYYFH